MQRRIEIHTSTDFSEEDVIRAMGRVTLDGDPEAALPGPVFALELDEDDRVFVDHMRPGRSSLEMLGAQRLAHAVNRCDRLTLGRVLMLASKGAAAGVAAWEHLRRVIPDPRLEEALDGGGDACTLAGLRMALVHDYMGTWNGCGDTWILWAAERFGKPAVEPTSEQLPLEGV